MIFLKSNAICFSKRTCSWNQNEIKGEKNGYVYMEKRAKSYLPLTLWNRYTVLLHHTELYQDLPTKSGFKHLNKFAMNLFNITLDSQSKKSSSEKGLLPCMAHAEQPDCSACRINIKRFQKHNVLVLGQLVIFGPGTRKKKKKKRVFLY